MAVLFCIAYGFVKSFATPSVNALLRIAIIAFGPIVFNLVVLIVVFFTSLVLGPMLSSCCNRYASIVAAIAHLLSVLGLVASFGLLWTIESFTIANAVLGMIAVTAIQRAFFKILIAVFLSREYKHDQTNRAFWSGKWSGTGMGSAAFGQVFREFVVKIVETSLFAADFLAIHLL